MYIYIYIYKNRSKCVYIYIYIIIVLGGAPRSHSSSGRDGVTYYSTQQ